MDTVHVKKCVKNVYLCRSNKDIIVYKNFKHECETHYLLPVLGRDRNTPTDVVLTYPNDTKNRKGHKSDGKIIRVKKKCPIVS